LNEVTTESGDEITTTEAPEEDEEETAGELEENAIQSPAENDEGQTNNETTTATVENVAGGEDTINDDTSLPIESLSVLASADSESNLAEGIQAEICSGKDTCCQGNVRNGEKAENRVIFKDIGNSNNR